jgi:hypothetical protein
MGMNHPNARLGISVCGLAARDEGEVAAVSRQSRRSTFAAPAVQLLAPPLPNGLFEPCLKHGQFRIIIPIDDINDQH